MGGEREERGRREGGERGRREGGERGRMRKRKVRKFCNLCPLSFFPQVVVVGNPANTNAMICSRFAPSIPKENFTCLTRLDQNRAQAQVRRRRGGREEGKEGGRRDLLTISCVYTQIAARVGVRADAVRNVIIWGNHSSTQFPDVAHACVLQNGTKTPVNDAVQDDAWIKGDFIKVC